MIRLIALNLRQFRGLKCPVALRFGEGMNVILGRNASGKSSLLRLIADISRDDLSAYKAEQLDLDYVIRTPKLGDIAVAIKHVSSVAGEREGSLDSELGTLPSMTHAFPERRRWTTETELAWHPSSGERFELKVRGNTAWFSGTNISESSELNSPELTAFEKYFRSSCIERLGTAKELGVHDATLKQLHATIFFSAFILPPRLDESLDAFHTITLGRSHEGETLFLSLVQKDDGEYSLGSQNLFSYTAVALLRQAAKTAGAREDLLLHSDNVRFLKWFVAQTRFSSATMRLSLAEKETVEGQVHLEYRQIDFQFETEGGAILNDQILSYGEKRLLTFAYWRELCEIGPLIADELVNGMHHEWVDACVEAMQGKQTFLTSQNPLLLDHLSFESSKEMQDAFLLASVEGDGTAMTWRNMSETEAQNLFAAYDARIQHMGELLRIGELW